MHLPSVALELKVSIGVEKIAGDLSLDVPYVGFAVLLALYYPALERLVSGGRGGGGHGGRDEEGGDKGLEKLHFARVFRVV